MGTPGHHSIRRWLAILATSATAAAAFSVLGTAGAFATTNPIALIDGAPISEVTEGDSTGSQIVGRFVDTRSLRSCDEDFYSATIAWGDGETSSGTVGCTLVVDPNFHQAVVHIAVYSVTGSHTYDDSGNYDIAIAVTNEEEGDDAPTSGKTDTAAIDDAPLFRTEAESQDVSGVEGQAIKVSGFFDDANNSFPDAGMTGTISWGDGSTSAGTVTASPDCDCADYEVSGTHIYDARNEPYTVTITLHDDGGSSAQATLRASVSDGALTAGGAKNLTAANGIVSNQALGSFTDAAGAQAAVGDFTATVNWGDGNSSAGTLVETADGAFNVNGTHTYATGGTRTVSIVVKDEEGATANLTATVTVPVLAATGQPAGASLPLGAIGLLLMGTMAIVGGVLIPVARRRR